MYAILFWEDSTFTVISLKTIVSPRKEIGNYVVGEAVKATFRGKLYSAHIYEISDDRSLLNHQLKNGMKLDLARLKVLDSSEPEVSNKESCPPQSSAVIQKTRRKRHSSSNELSKTDNSKKQRKSVDGTSSSNLNEKHSPIQEKDPLVEQAMQILQKRRALVKSTDVTAPSSQTSQQVEDEVTTTHRSSNLTQLTTIPATTCIESRAFESEEPMINEFGYMPAGPPNSAISRNFDTYIPVENTLTSVENPAAQDWHYTATTVENSTMSISPTSEGIFTPSVNNARSDWNSLSQSTPLPVNRAMYTLHTQAPAERPITPARNITSALKNQTPSDTYMSLLESPFENEHSDSGCHSCSMLMKRLESRVADLEAQVKAMQNREAGSLGRKVTPAQTPLVPRVLQYSNNVQQKENDLNGASTEAIVADTIQYEKRLPKALSKAMRAVFTQQQLATCSFKGGVTSKGAPRPGLPETERDIIIDIIARQFALDTSTVEGKMRSALHRFCKAYSGLSPDKDCVVSGVVQGSFS